MRIWKALCFGAYGGDYEGFTGCWNVTGAGSRHILASTDHLMSSDTLYNTIHLNAELRSCLFW